MEIGDVFRKIYDVIYHRPMNFSFVDNYICGSARIMSKKDIDWLKKKKVKSILALTEASAPSPWFEGSGILYKHVPVKNHFAPTLASWKNVLISLNETFSRATRLWCTVRRARGEPEP